MFFGKSVFVLESKFVIGTPGWLFHIHVYTSILMNTLHLTPETDYSCLCRCFQWSVLGWDIVKWWKILNYTTLCKSTLSIIVEIYVFISMINPHLLTTWTWRDILYYLLFGVFLVCCCCCCCSVKRCLINLLTQCNQLLCVYTFTISRCLHILPIF